MSMPVLKSKKIEEFHRVGSGTPYDDKGDARIQT